MAASRGLGVCVLSCVSTPITQIGIKARPARCPERPAARARCHDERGNQEGAATAAQHPRWPGPAKVPRAHSVSGAGVSTAVWSTLPVGSAAAADRGRRRHQVGQAAEHGRPHPARHRDPMITPAAAPGTMADAALSSTLWSPAYVTAATTEIGSTAAIVVPLAAARAIPTFRDVSTGTMTTPRPPPVARTARPPRRLRLREPRCGRPPATPDPGHEAGSGLQRCHVSLLPPGPRRPECGLKEDSPIQVALSLQRSPLPPGPVTREVVTSASGRRVLAVSCPPAGWRFCVSRQVTAQCAFDLRLNLPGSWRTRGCPTLVGGSLGWPGSGPGRSADRCRSSRLPSYQESAKRRELAAPTVRAAWSQFRWGSSSLLLNPPITVRMPLRRGGSSASPSSEGRRPGSWRPGLARQGRFSQTRGVKRVKLPSAVVEIVAGGAWCWRSWSAGQGPITRGA